MFTVRKTKDSPAIEIPVEVESAGGEAIEAYVAASADGRATMLTQLRAREAARVKAQEEAWAAANRVAEDAPSERPARRRGAPSPDTPTSE